MAGTVITGVVIPYKINNRTAKAPKSPRAYSPLAQNGYAYMYIGNLYTHPSQLEVCRRRVTGTPHESMNLGEIGKDAPRFFSGIRRIFFSYGIICLKLTKLLCNMLSGKCKNVIH